MAIENELKFEGGVPSGKLNVPPKSCMPKRAKMRMNKNRSNKSEIIDFIELNKEMTRFLKEDQYLKKNKILIENYLTSNSFRIVF